LETTYNPKKMHSGSICFGDDNVKYFYYSTAISAIDEPSQRQHRINSFIPSHLRSELPQQEENVENHFLEVGCCKSRIPKWCKYFKFPHVLEPQSKTLKTICKFSITSIYKTLL